MNQRIRTRTPIGPSPLIVFIVGLDQLAWRPSTICLLDSVSRAAERQQAGLMLCTDVQEPSQVLRNFVSSGQVSGVLIRAQAADQPWVRELVATVPSVMIGAHRMARNLHVVETETVESTASLVGAMFDAGCERLAMVAGAEERVDADDRLEGFRLAHIQRGLTADPALVFSGDYSRQRGYEVADRVLAVQPDGVFAANDETAKGIVERAAELGMDIPGDLMIAGFDGVGDAQVKHLDIATVRQPWDDIATTAVQTLLGIVHGMDMPRERLVDPEISLGETIGPSLGSTTNSSPMMSRQN